MWAVIIVRQARSPPFAADGAAIRFIDCINRGDVFGLGELMTDDHALVVLDGPSVVGRDANRDAWHRSFSSSPTT